MGKESYGRSVTNVGPRVLRHKLNIDQMGTVHKFENIKSIRRRFCIFKAREEFGRG